MQTFPRISLQESAIIPSHWCPEPILRLSRESAVSFLRFYSTRLRRSKAQVDLAEAGSRLASRRCQLRLLRRRPRFRAACRRLPFRQCQIVVADRRNMTGTASP